MSMNIKKIGNRERIKCDIDGRNGNECWEIKNNGSRKKHDGWQELYEYVWTIWTDETVLRKFVECYINQRNEKPR
jgi:hypothetical protein